MGSDSLLNERIEAALRMYLPPETDKCVFQVTGGAATLSMVQAIAAVVRGWAESEIAARVASLEGERDELRNREGVIVADRALAVEERNAMMRERDRMAGEVGALREALKSIVDNEVCTCASHFGCSIHSAGYLLSTPSAAALARDEALKREARAGAYRSAARKIESHLRGPGALGPLITAEVALNAMVASLEAEADLESTHPPTPPAGRTVIEEGNGCDTAHRWVPTAAGGNRKCLYCGRVEQPKPAIEPGGKGGKS